jgi:NAD(P)H-dependent flavin oxidoreductase YrpB (nitropropane dioxygenase family)
MLPRRFTELVGCELPIQQAGMGGVASPDLAVAVSDAGGLGTVALHTMPAAMVADTLDATARQTSAPLAFNVLMPFLDRDAVEAASSRCRLVEFFYGDPDAELVRLVRDGGALAAWQVGSVGEAKAARDAGCDVVIAQGVEAGGHVRGRVGLLALLASVLDAVDLPVIAAGGIGSAASAAAATASPSSSRAARPWRRACSLPNQKSHGATSPAQPCRKMHSMPGTAAATASRSGATYSASQSTVVPPTVIGCT